MHGFRPENIYDVTLVEDPRVSPDGRRVAFVVKRFDRESNEYPSAIWIASASFSGEPAEVAGESFTLRAPDPEPRPFTSGEHRDLRPRWSPDGRSIAFVSHREPEENASQLYVIPVDGGEPRRIAAHPEEIEELAWSPDGTRIAYLVRDREEDRYGREREKDQPPRKIGRLIYRLDSAGWTIDRPRHLFVIDVDGAGEPLQLTAGEFQDEGLAWSPDGERIAFTSARHETWDTDLATDLFVVPAGGGDPAQLTSTGAYFSSPSWSPDGGAIAFVWAPTPMNRPRHGRVGVIDLETREVRILSEDLDRNATTYPAVREPIWAEGDLYFSIEDQGNLHIYRVPADGSGKPEPVLGENRWIVGLDIAAGTTALVVTTPIQPGELVLITDETKRAAGELVETVGKKGKSAAKKGLGAGAHGFLQERQVTKFGAALTKEVELVPPLRFTATSPDGSEVEAWVMRPANFETGRRYPTLLNIHGGPFTQYGNKFFDESHVYTGAGYAVVYSNPRGSSGYSEAWGRAIKGPKAEDPGSGWGGVDYDDLMAAVDEAIRRFPFIDPDRLGVIGGSYGGFMTSWIVGHTGRFKAACSERGVNNQLTMAFTSDLGPYFRSYIGPTHLEDPEEYLRQSPITYVENVRTPLLILHSEQDLRCPVSQAEELFVALRMLGREVEFVRFPGESHELSRSGAPRHREERFRIILDFFDRHLKS